MAELKPKPNEVILQMPDGYPIVVDKDLLASKTNEMQAIAESHFEKKLVDVRKEVVVDGVTLSGTAQEMHKVYKKDKNSLSFSNAWRALFGKELRNG